MANPFAGVRWLWMLLGGVIVEVVLFAIAALLYAVAPDVEAALNWVTPPACLVASFLVAFWVVRRAKASFVMNGVVLGAVAALLYAPAFFFAEDIPLSYVIAEALKVIGGAAGGAVAGAQAGRRAAA